MSSACTSKKLAIAAGVGIAAVGAYVLYRHTRRSDAATATGTSTPAAASAKAATATTATPTRGSSQQGDVGAVTVSAPGKVLVTGGYLVLRSLPGLTLSTTARFRTTASWRDAPVSGAGAGAGAGAARRADARTVGVVVTSPQLWCEWRYTMEVNHPFKLASVDGKRNKFVERAVECAMQVFGQVVPDAGLTALLQGKARRGLELHLHLVADNDFYSQRGHLESRGLPVNAETLATLPEHIPCRRDDAGGVIVAKTGMGSSAALVTSLVGCLAAFLGVATLPRAQDAGDVVAPPLIRGGERDEVKAVRLVHHVAQVAHALAQGKVGSGFDVSSAALGSQRYVRVPAGTLRSYLDRLDTTDASAMLPVVTELADSRHSDWEYKVTPFALPPGTELMMADVCGGSETPSMVRKILAWKAAGGEGGAPDQLWATLAQVNDDVEAAFADLRALAKADAASYFEQLSACAKVQPSKWAGMAAASRVAEALSRLHASFRLTRTHLKRMGEEAGVPVEPDEQSKLADGTLEVPGVVAAGVPGAGGYDALYAVILSGSSDDTRRAVGEYWSRASGGKVCPLLLTAEAGFGAGAGVRQEA